MRRGAERDVAVRAGGRRTRYLEQVSLSATGFYRTPDIGYDRATGSGKPFHYFAYGAAVTEVEVDGFTGKKRVRRVDILHDVRRLAEPGDRPRARSRAASSRAWAGSPARSCGGTRRAGSRRTRRARTRSPPGRRARATSAWRCCAGADSEATIHGSKAVGEPPLMLAISVFEALRDAVAAVEGGRLAPRLDAPATPERVLLAIEELRGRALAAPAPAPAFLPACVGEAVK